MLAGPVMSPKAGGLGHQHSAGPGQWPLVPWETMVSEVPLTQQQREEKVSGALATQARLGAALWSGLHILCPLPLPGWDFPALMLLVVGPPCEDSGAFILQMGKLGLGDVMHQDSGSGRVS